MKLIIVIRHWLWRRCVRKTIDAVLFEHYDGRVYPRSGPAIDDLNERMGRVRKELNRSNLTEKYKIEHYIKREMIETIDFIIRIDRGEVTYH